MLPGNFIYGACSADGGQGAFQLAQSVFNSHLNNSPLSLSGLPSNQSIEHVLLQNSLRGLNIGSLLPYLTSQGLGNQSAISAVSFLPSPVQIAPIGCTNPLVFCNPTGAIALPINSVVEPTTNDVDAHTIVRAPVLYKNNSSDASNGILSTATTTTTTALESQQSPPDRIVASYAAAAHAAALANHQPVSKAAEVYLAATTAPRPRHPKRLRNHAVSTAVTRSDVCDGTNPVSSMVSSAFTLSTSPSVSSPAEGSGRSGWTRIVDRKAGSVVYISPEGIQLHDRNEVYAYFRMSYPSFADGKNYGDLIASCFVFEPTTETPLVEDGLSLLSALRPNESSTTIGPACTTSSDVIADSVALSSSSTNVSTESSHSKTSATVCRISFNPNHTMNESSSPIKRPRLTASISESKVLKSDVNTSVSSNQQVMADALPITSSSDQLTPTTVSCIPSTVEPTVTNVSVTVTIGAPSAILSETRNHCNDELPVPIDQLANQTLSNVSATCSSLHASLSPASLATSIVTCSSVSTLPDNLFEPKKDDSVVRMTTETLTTGTLHTSIPSCDLSVIPSTVPPLEPVNGATVGTNEMDCMASATSLLAGPLTNPENVNQLITLNQLFASSRLAEAQQQQHLAAVLAAMSNVNGNNQSYSNLHAISLNNGLPLTPILLGAPQPWAPGAQAAAAWPDLSMNVSNVSNFSNLQQQLITASVLQQHQAAAHTAALLRRHHQQVLAAQQHQQALARVQNYLAAVQRQLPNEPR